ncbi:MAG: thiamine phosphate synthase [Chitinophagales bacterium]|nr:thiamine phosphate synthase [Chitinophagales bacterium]
MNVDFKIVVLSSPGKVKDELKIVKNLFEAGMDTYHLRKPRFSPKEMQHYILNINERFRNRIMIHSHYQFFFKYKLCGIHFSESNRKKNFWKNIALQKLIKFRKKDAEISTGFHAQSDILSCGNDYSYVFLSPVFESISKIGYSSTFNEQSLRETLRSTKYRVIALGGIDESKIESAKDFGFSGVALLGSIWKSSDPVEKFCRIKKLC